MTRTEATRHWIAGVRPWLAGFNSRAADLGLGWCLGMLTAVAVVAIYIGAM